MYRQLTIRACAAGVQALQRLHGICAGMLHCTYTAANAATATAAATLRGYSHHNELDRERQLGAVGDRELQSKIASCIYATKVV